MSLKTPAGAGALLLLAGLSAPASPSQPVERREVERCARLADDAARLRCFDALAGRGAVPAAPAAPSRPPEPAASPEPPAQPFGPAPVADPPRPPVPADPPTEAVRTPDGGPGAERLERRGPRRMAPARAVVASVVRVGRGNLEFRMEDGSVWRQIEARTFPHPRDGRFEVEITQGLLGEYRLRVDGRGRMARVRRVR